ncbi:MAG TPA: YncE family protein, partial [Solirubrobacteraceae bacterium]
MISPARRLRSILIAVGVIAGLSGGALAVADSLTTGEIGPSLSITGNGRLLHPVGRLVTVGNFPTGSALTPDGRHLWVTDCGHGSDDVKVVDVASGQVQQTLALPGCYGGIAITRDGARAYVGGTPKGDSPTDGPTQGNQGDVIHSFSINPATGMGTELAPLALPSTSGGSGRINSLPPTSGVGSAYPEGLAISPDQSKLVVALNEADKAAIIDLHSHAESTVPTGAYPDGVAFDHSGLAYISNEYDGTVTVINPGSAAVVATISGLGGSRGDLNSHPEGMVTDPVRHRIYVAVTNHDLIATIDTDTKRVIALTSVGREPGLGTAPVKLAVSPDGQTLYSADSGEDAVAAISLTARPKAGVPVIPRRVARPVKLASLIRYHQAQRRAAAALSTALAHAGSPSARSRARRRYAGALRRLNRRWLQIRTTRACAGPTIQQMRAYIRAVLRDLGIRSRRRRGRRLAQARRWLPAIRACRAAPGYLPNLPALHLIGRLPTAAYPDDVQVTP